MSRQTFPVFVDQPGLIIHNFSITGASVALTDGTAGLDGRGKFLCTIYKDGGSQIFTITWNVAFAERPYVHVQLGIGQADIPVVQTSSTASTLVITVVGANPVLDLTVFGYITKSFVS